MGKVSTHWKDAGLRQPVLCFWELTQVCLIQGSSTFFLSGVLGLCTNALWAAEENSHDVWKWWGYSERWGLCEGFLFPLHCASWAMSAQTLPSVLSPQGLCFNCYLKSFPFEHLGLGDCSNSLPAEPCYIPLLPLGTVWHWHWDFPGKCDTTGPRPLS